MKNQEGLRQSEVNGHVLTALSVLAGCGLEKLARTMGITEEDVSLMKQDSLWMPAERHVVRRAIDGFLFGALDALGINRFPIPAEYIAAWVSLLVSPVNWQVAAHWYHGTHSAGAIMADPEQLLIEDGVTAQAVYALVLQCHASVLLGCRGEFGDQLAESMQRLMTEAGLVESDGVVG